MKLSEFLKEVDALRRASGEKYFSWIGKVDGKQVRLKACGTWNQLLEVDGIVHGGVHCLNVTRWKNELKEAINYKGIQS